MRALFSLKMLLARVYYLNIILDYYESEVYLLTNTHHNLNDKE